MAIKTRFIIRSNILKSYVTKYALLGLVLSLFSIIIASILVSYQLTGEISISGIIEAHKTNPAIWALDLTPFMFAYWGQSFCYDLASTAENIIESKTRKYVNKSSDLETKLEHQTYHDNLTNIPNSRLLTERIKKSMGQLAKEEKLAVIVLYITNLKDINYQFGSFSGNSILVQFAEKLKTNLIEPYMLQNFMGMNMIARVEGAVFAVLLPRVRKDHDLDNIATNLVKDSTINFMMDGHKIKVKVTGGVALYPDHGEDENELIQHAIFSALEAEKENAKYLMYDAKMNAVFKERSTIIQQITDALEAEDLKIAYEPIVSFKTKKIKGAKLRLDLNDNRFGALSDARLHSLLRGSEIESKVLEFMLKKAVKKASVWKKEGFNIYVSVNLFKLDDIHLVSLLEELLQKQQIDPKNLMVELTEQVCLADQALTLKVLEHIHNLGIKICISDFASGYASFTYLPNFPIDEIKISKNFVLKMLVDEKQKRIVSSIIKIAQAMHLSTQAAGVDDKLLYNELLKLGAEGGIGEYFSKPVDEYKFTELLRHE